MTLNGRLLPRAFLSGLAFAVILSPALAGGRAAEAPPPERDVVVLIGRYICNAINYGVLDAPPITMLDHSISFSATGLQIAPGPAPGAGSIGPGFGGRAPFNRPDLPTGLISNVGLATSVNLGEGTLQQCTAIAQSIAAAAGNEGCVASHVRTSAIPSSVISTATFSLVCEGEAADQIRIIGDLSRAVVMTELP